MTGGIVIYTNDKIVNIQVGGGHSETHTSEHTMATFTPHLQKRI